MIFYFISSLFSVFVFVSNIADPPIQFNRIPLIGRIDFFYSFEKKNSNRGRKIHLSSVGKTSERETSCMRKSVV